VEFYIEGGDVLSFEYTQTSLRSESK